MRDTYRSYDLKQDETLLDVSHLDLGHCQPIFSLPSSAAGLSAGLPDFLPDFSPQTFQFTNVLRQISNGWTCSLVMGVLQAIAIACILVI